MTWPKSASEKMVSGWQRFDHGENLDELDRIVGPAVP